MTPTIAGDYQALPIASLSPNDKLLLEGENWDASVCWSKAPSRSSSDGYQITISCRIAARSLAICRRCSRNPHMAHTCPRKLTLSDVTCGRRRRRLPAIASRDRLSARESFWRSVSGVTTYLVDLKHQFEDHDNHLGIVDDIRKYCSTISATISRQARTAIRVSQIHAGRADKIIGGRCKGASSFTSSPPSIENHAASPASVSTAICVGVGPICRPLLNTQVLPTRSNHEPPLAERRLMDVAREHDIGLVVCDPAAEARIAPELLPIPRVRRALRRCVMHPDPRLLRRRGIARLRLHLLLDVSNT